jgi:diguanylate cyclase (GGDEF)-like protein/PAS domain S-box-containing protein
MKRMLDSWERRTDLFSLLLGFFFFILIILFLYLSKIDRDIENYDTYHHKLDSMRLLDYRLDNFFFKAHQYIDYDMTIQLEKAFEEKIDFLKREDVKQAFDPHIYQMIEKIDALYREKKTALEDFKALNARVTNSIYFLFDLRRSMEKTLLIAPEKKVLVDRIFFNISQILIDIPYDEKAFAAELDQLLPYTKESRLFLSLYQHANQFLRNVKAIRVIKKKVAKIPLLKQINIVLEDLDKQYKQNRYWQKLIAFILFVFAFIILGLLIYSYRRIRRNTRELQAFRYAIENSDNAIVITNVLREIEYVNEAFEKRSGYTKEEVLGKNPNILKSNLLSDDFYQEMNEILDRGEIWQGELINCRKDGSLLYEKASIIPIFVEGRLTQYLAVKLDITEYKEQQQRLKQASVVYEMTGDGILVTDKDKRIISANPAFVKMFGYSEAELLGEEPMVIRTLKEDTYVYRKMWDQLLNQGRWSDKVYNKTKDGTVLPVWLTLTVVRNEDNEIENFIAIYTNLQEIIETQERAEYLAYHDSLTHLPNRAYFELRIKDILDMAEASQKQVAILFLDLDRFKVINDTLGHAVGDDMLVELAKRMKKLFNDEVLLARLGGDEFVVTFIVERGKAEVKKIASQILAIIREPIHVHDYHLTTTASIGIALYPDDATAKDEIVKYADSAMYAAKEKGKDRYQFYTKQLSLDVQARLGLEQELLHALKKRELYLHYQPQYLLETREVTGAEALVRWKSAILGQVSPEEFISIAEETGLIVEIGYFIFEEACKAYKRWEAEGYAIDTIAINVSTVQFREERFLEKLKTILDRTGMRAESIEIEITERFIMEYTTTNMTILEDLRALGCRIAIDDFGTGYSSMSYMKQMPLDTIKIDRSFIMDLPDNSHDAEVSKAIIALSKSLGYQVVAEGIENEVQEEFLRHNGCDIGQGYYFAHPMNGDTFLDFLKKKRAECLESVVLTQ